MTTNNNEVVHITTKAGWELYDQLKKAREWSAGVGYDALYDPYYEKMTVAIAAIEKEARSRPEPGADTPPVGYETMADFLADVADAESRPEPTLREQIAALPTPVRGVSVISRDEVMALLDAYLAALPASPDLAGLREAYTYADPVNEYQRGYNDGVDIGIRAVTDRVSRAAINEQEQPGSRYTQAADQRLRQSWRRLGDRIDRLAALAALPASPEDGLASLREQFVASNPPAVVARIAVWRLLGGDDDTHPWRNAE